MQYMVTGMDGKEYGPTDLATLKTWVAENRLAAHTMLRDFHSGQTLAASAVPGLFPSAGLSNVPPVGAPYPRQAVGYSSAVAAGDHGREALIGVLFRCGIAIVLAFVIGGLGFVSSAYAMYYAVQCQRSGSKYGIVSLVIAGATLIAVGTVYAIRVSTHHT